MNELLLTEVAEAIQNARENGYDVENMSPEDLASDMYEYDAFLAQYAVEEVATAIQEYRKQ